MAKLTNAGVLFALGLFVSGFMYQPEVIYGDDNRLDVYQVPDARVQKSAASTAVMVLNKNISATTAGQDTLFKIAAKNFGSTFNLCQDEPFREQPMGGFCSAFLVGKNLVATAGHCVNTTDCSTKSFVFGFKMLDAKNAVTEFPQGQIYGCKKVLAWEKTREQDYALVQLDRDVEGIEPLVLQAQPVHPNDAIMVIGNPSGLPTKVAAGAGVRRLGKGFFAANLDTYGGNSGSAVFDANTNQVIGILVRGENDFVGDSAAKCTRSNRCESDLCRGEDATYIQYIINALNNIQQ